MPTAAEILTRADARQSAAQGVPDAVRVGYVAVVVTALFNHAWFVDLGDRALMDTVEGGSLGTQLLYAGLALATLPLLWRLGPARLRPLATPPNLLFSGWFALTTLLSTDPLLSIRRAALFAIVVLLAATLLVVARTVRQFALGLAIACATVLAACYLGVLLVPHLSVHTAYDLIDEAQHTGLWRGIFPHKNEAGSAMALIALCGLHVAAARERWLGYGISAAAALFLAFTGSKTPALALVLVLVVSGLVRPVRGRAWRALILLGPLALMSLATVGAVLLEPVRAVLERVLPDATFTARNEIWSFAIDNILKHPVKGWGYGAFWLTDATVYGSVVDPDSNWVQTATQAHNSFLDAALVFGLPGLCLAVVAFVLAPVADFQRATAGGRIDPAAELFLRLWQVTMLSASFEGILFNPNAAACGLTLLGVFGLRMLAVRPVIA